MKDVLVILGSDIPTLRIDPYKTTLSPICLKASGDEVLLEQANAALAEVTEVLGDYNVDISLNLVPDDTDAFIALMTEMTNRDISRDEADAMRKDDPFFLETSEAHQQYIRICDMERATLPPFARQRRWDNNPRSIRETMRRQRRGKR